MRARGALEAATATVIAALDLQLGGRRSGSLEIVPQSKRNGWNVSRPDQRVPGGCVPRVSDLRRFHTRILMGTPF